MYDPGTTTFAIAKKLQNKPRFLFSRWLDCRIRVNLAKKAHNSQREQQNPTEGNEINPVKERCRQGWMCFLPISQAS